MTSWLKLRASEWILVGFFAYIALVSHWFQARPNLHHQPLLILGCVVALFAVFSRIENRDTSGVASMVRDFLPPAITLVAFREMELFLPPHFDHHLENFWIHWDRTLLEQWQLRAIIEYFGFAIPLYLELCYLLVYGLPIYCLAVLYTQEKRLAIDRFLVVYLTGTLLAYCLFPYFPSEPPRLVFPQVSSPAIETFFRRINLAILQAATIHVGVFPSAHVSSAFAASWGMFLVIPKRRVFGYVLLFYALSVSLATIYGRYHYTADVLAGFAVSLVAAALALWLAFHGNAKTVMGPGCSPDPIPVLTTIEKTIYRLR